MADIGEIIGALGEMHREHDRKGKSIGAGELILYAENDEPLYRQEMAIVRNLATKKARGAYQKDLAKKAFRLYLARPAAEKYCKVFGSGKWSECFNKDDLEDFAAAYVESFEGEYKLGNYEALLPKKYQKKATKKATEAAIAAADQERNRSIGEKEAPGSGLRARGGSRNPHRGLPPGTVAPHGRETSRCVKCGEIHSTRAHKSHAVRGGRVGRDRAGD